MNVIDGAKSEVAPARRAWVEPVIEIKNLDVSYRGRRALRPTSLAIRPRAITALIGPSGCGKTSLLMCLNRLIDLVPGACCGGSAYLDGHDVLCRSADVLALRKRVGMVFQRPNPFPFSIRRNFDLVFAEAGLKDRGRREERMRECLTAVGLWDEVATRLNTPATELSGGQQQRLCIARALATDPDILLLDEPCSALDPMSTMAIERLLMKLKERVTLVIVTHNLPQACRIADDCALFWTENGSGYLLECGSMSDLLHTPAHPTTADYLGGRLA